MKIDLFAWFILSALAAFRIARMLVIDDGPFGIFMNLRGWSISSNVLLRNIGNALSCVHCAGLYISAIFAVGYFFQNVYLLGILLAFAIAGLQSFMASLLGSK